MRASIAIMLSIALMFVMITAVGIQADETESAATSDGQQSEDAWQFSTDLFDGVGQAAGPAMAFGGVAAFVLIALGVAVKAGGRGR